MWLVQLHSPTNEGMRSIHIDFKKRQKQREIIYVVRIDKCMRRNMHKIKIFMILRRNYVENKAVSCIQSGFLEDITYGGIVAIKWFVSLK